VARAATDAAAAVAEATGEEDAVGHPVKRAETADTVARGARAIEAVAVPPPPVLAERAGPTSPSVFRERMATMRAASQSSGETTPERSSLESIEASLEATSSVLATLLITSGSTHGSSLDIFYAPSLDEVLYAPSRDATLSKDRQGQQGFAAEASDETKENEETEATEAIKMAVESFEVPEQNEAMQTPGTTEATVETNVRIRGHRGNDGGRDNN
jgi:hypothetical protein